MQGRQKPLTGGSLVKSRDLLNSFAQRLAQAQCNRENSRIIESIQQSSQKIQFALENKIEDNYNLILNRPTLMPILQQPLVSEPNAQSIPSLLSPLEGAKSLMYKYWQHKNGKNTPVAKSSTLLSRTFQTMKSESRLPNIKSQQEDFKVAPYIRLREKNQELGIGLPARQENNEDYHTKVKIVNFKCQNESKPFLKFMKAYYRNWEEIASILKALEKFAEHYHLPTLTALTLQIFSLIERVRRGQRISPHDLLGCCEQPEAISQQSPRKQGIRFFGKAGELRAAVVIQSHARRYLERKRHQQRLKEWRAAKLIQGYFRVFQLRRSFRKQLFQRLNQKLQDFKLTQARFVDSFKQKQVTQGKRYEIHIPSHSWSDWQKVSMPKFVQKQNAELCRIFRAAAKDAPCQLHVIYVSPLPLSKEILNYYFKLFQLGSDFDIQQRLTVVAPQTTSPLPCSLSLAQHLYYSPQALNKIKKTIGNAYAYIVPSAPANDYIHLCDYLNVPLYGGAPQKAAYLETRGGCKAFQQSLRQSRGDLGNCLPVLPYSSDIYSEFSLLNELTNLVYCYPEVRRWVLKIDNECESRGVAYLDVSKVLGTGVWLRAESKKAGEKAIREQIYSALENALVINKEERVIRVDKKAYCGQAEYLQHFYTRGGIVEAAINNFETELQNACYCVDLKPSGDWHLLTSYYKVTNKHKALAAYFADSMAPPLIIEAIVGQLRAEGQFGYFCCQFLSVEPKGEASCEGQVQYLNSVKCSLDQYSSAQFLRAFISPSSNSLYVPVLSHPALKELRMQTFFHLCRLQNISFDIEQRVGNIFTFLDAIQGGCIGIMTFNATSKSNCYAHTAEVLEFLNSQGKVKGREGEGSEFLGLKNAVNGFLKREKKMKRKQQH